MTPETPISVPSHVLAETLNDETVLLDMSNGMYFGLTPVASRFWKLLAAGTARDEINSILLSEFEIEPEVLKADLDALLAELEAKKLIDRTTV
ncbi:MAG: PqqD family protein [Granulicella sp.]